jgi:nitrogen fixation NifU-like protein
MALNYTKKTMKHFLEPKNVGQIKNPDGYAQIGNMVCGDQLDFFLKVEKGRVKDVKFLSFGCASNIATASVLTAKVKGMTIEEAKKYPWQKIVSELGGLPHQKVHCSVMAVQGLQKAIADYEKNKVIEPALTRKVNKKKNNSITKKQVVKKTSPQKGKAITKTLTKKTKAKKA